MPFLILALLLGQQPAVPTRIPADSYADSATARLVAHARAARERNERLVTSYTASVSQKIGAGLHALSRDRMLFHEELTADISWKRDGQSTITVTGARQAIPVATRKDQLPSDLDASFRWLVVNPAEDYLGMLGADADGFVYPLKEGGELDYRYAVGDTTVITLPSGKTIRLLQLVVTPRRSEWRLMSGSLWFDAETYGLVRAVFKPARPYDLRRDGDKEDLEDVPSWVNVKGEIKFITLEYAYYENRWWMLRYAALDAVGNMGSWLGVPVKFERIYSDYHVEGGTPPPPGSKFRPAGTVRPRERDSLPPEDPEEAAMRRQLRRTERRTCLEKAQTRQEANLCWRGNRARDSVLTVVVPEDTLKLLTSPTLGPPILEMGDLVTESELKGLADAIGVLPTAPLGSSVELPRGVGAVLSRARYNRVEGLSLGAGGLAQTGRVTIDGLARIGLADGVPRGELGVSFLGRGSRFRLGGYRRLAAMNPETRPFGIVNSVSGLLAQRDDGEYFRTLGAELTGQNPETGWWSWRLYAERQEAERVETRFSVPHLFNSDRAFRPNTPADRADAFGASLTLRGNKPLSRTVQFGGELTLDATGGDFRYGRGNAAFHAIITPRSLPALAFEAAAGTSTGTMPAQSRFYLGGPATLRGYSGAISSGEAYWRGRAEVGNTFPAVRLTAFSDIGWAGPRSAFGHGKPLLGAGIGASFLDGLIRLDLARGMRAPKGWRFDLYFDGKL